jgi:ATP-dependent Lon protease
MFICTANSLDLSNPLLNRLELIEVPGYSREEKLEIANNHLIPLQIKENGVEGLALFENDGLKEIIQYSNELGVRGLERSISKICRKIARKGTKELVTADKVEEYLGKRHKK